MAEIDNYLPCEQYAAAPDSEKYPGYKSWQDTANGNWYFAAVTNRGRVVLRSEAYTTEAARDNGIDSVSRNRDIEARYSVVQDENDGQWYIVLKAGNHQEIARSCAFGSEAAATADIAMCASDAVESAAIIEDYLACEAYAGHNASEKYPGFVAFTDEGSGQHHFAAVNAKGKVLLRSEAYTTEASRDNGIESVMRNRDIEARYSVVQDENDGQWYIVLKAGNHQEIARSCAFDSEAAATAGIALCASEAANAAAVVEDYLPCEAYAGHHASEKYPGFTTFTDAESGQHFFAVVDKSGHVVMRSEAYKSESSRNNGIESVQRNRELEERYSVVQDESDGQWYVILKAGNHQEIARSCGHDSEAGAAAWLTGLFAKPAAAAIVEDYLACEAYAGQSVSEKHPGFSAFTNAEDGQHYFAMVDGHGGVILRSEAYTTAAARDNGIESVLKNRDIEARYSIAQDESDGLWYVALKAGNHQEIARSCGHADKATAEGHLLHCYSREALEKIATGEGEIIEDYLPCKAYEGHPASSFEGFTIFQDPKTGLHYFAMLDDDGNVALKSEGYKDPKRRDNGIESVLRNRGIKDHWREVEDEHGHYMSLKAVNHQEIARSCHKKDKAAMLAWFAPFLAAHAGWGNDAEPEEVVAAVTPPTPTKVVVNTEKPAAAPITSYTNAPAAPVATTGGNDWWKWLLGLLLLGLLAWLLMRGCDGCGKKTPPPAPPTPPTTAVPADTLSSNTVTAAPAPAPAASCNCEDQTDPVFRPSKGTPQSLTRLGTNPEFGNSHDLSPAGFYDKLADRSKNNAVDKRFLDRVFKAMGYKNGFADAKPEMFSATDLAAGTVGNIGYSKAHKTLYARLDTQPNDLKAFRIKAANGCDLHFMKTCGNHFFFCGK